MAGEMVPGRAGTGRRTGSELSSGSFLGFLPRNGRAGAGAGEADREHPLPGCLTRINCFRAGQSDKSAFADRLQPGRSKSQTSQPLGTKILGYPHSRVPQAHLPTLAFPSQAPPKCCGGVGCDAASAASGEKENVLPKGTLQKMRRRLKAGSRLAGRSEECPLWRDGRYSCGLFHSLLRCTSCNGHVNQCSAQPALPDSLLLPHRQDYFCPEPSETSSTFLFV